jgi:hypothetical protein
MCEALPLWLVLCQTLVTSCWDGPVLWGTWTLVWHTLFFVSLLLDSRGWNRTSPAEERAVTQRMVLHLRSRLKWLKFAVNTIRTNCKYSRASIIRTSVIRTTAAKKEVPNKFSMHHYLNICWLSFTNHFLNQLFDDNISHFRILNAYKYNLLYTDLVVITLSLV